MTTDADIRHIAGRAVALYAGGMFPDSKDAKAYFDFAASNCLTLARWVMARLGQEDVMDAEVAEIEKRHEHFEGINAQTGSAGSVLHRDRATLLKKLRAVTPAVTLPTRPPKTISRGGIGWSHDDDPLVK